MYIAFASSIGIIGIAVILSLSTGFNDKIEEAESNTLAEFPITITQTDQEIDMKAMHDEMSSTSMGKKNI